MAELQLIYPKNQVKQLRDVDKEVTNIDEAILKLTKDLQALKGVLNEQNTTFSKLVEVQKKANTLNEKAEKTNKKLKDSEKKLTEIEKERLRIQKQQQTANAKKIVSLDKENIALQKTRAEIQKQNREIKKNITISQAQKGSYDKIAASLSKNIAKWKSLSQAERENTAAGKRLTATIQRQDAALKKLDAQVGRSQRHVGNYGRAIKGVATQLMGAFGLTGGILILVGVLKKAFSTIRSFSKENAVLAGVLGKTREEVEKLTDQAVALGSVYPITASEVVKLQVAFARLGFTQQDIISLTEATIQGSIALNSSLDATATLVGAVVRAYQSLGTSDAKKIIDQLTRATQISSQSFETLETALPKVAGAASAMNITLSKTLSLLGIAQDATLDASIAGTSLRKIFLELTNKGISLEAALGRINTSSNKLREAYDLFGARAAIVGLALADNIEKIDEFDTALQDAGDTAANVAKTQMNTLDGAIKGLGSSWEKLVLSFRDNEGFLAESIRGTAQELDLLSDEFVSFGGAIEGILFPKGSVVKAMKRRNELFQIIKTGTDDEIAAAIFANRRQLEENEKFNQKVQELLNDRIESEEKAAKEAAKRAELARKQAEVERIAKEKEEQEERAKKEKKADDKSLSEQRKADKEFLDMASKTRAKLVVEEDNAQEEADENFKKANEDRLKEAQRNANEQSDIIRAKNQKIIEDEKEAARERAQIERELQDLKFELLSGISEATFSFIEGDLNKKSEALETEKQLILSNENLTTEEERIQAQFAIREQEIEKKRKAAQKFQAAAEIGISTAKSILQIKLKIAELTAAATLNPLLSPLIPLVAAQIPFVLGSAALALAGVAAFEKGTENAPSEFIAGDKKGGGSARELMFLKDGTVMMVNEPTYFKGSQFKGATIKSNPETEKIMSSTYHGGYSGMTDTNIVRELSEVKRAISKKPTYIIDNTGKIKGYRYNNYKEKISR